LLRLALQIPPVAQDPVLDQLLGDRRPTLADLARRQVVDEGPRHAANVDPGILPERLVLRRDHRVDQDLRHLAQVGRLSVLDADLADLVAAVVVYERRLRQVAEAAERPPALSPATHPAAAGGP